MSERSAAVLSGLDGPVATIRFNRPSALNALDQDMAECFLAACRAIRAARGVRVVLIAGEGRAFMAGADLSRFQADPVAAAGTARALIEPLHEALAILCELGPPVVASLHGAVAGPGASVALACDLALAAHDVRFNLAHARIGASPDAGASWSLPRVVGLRKAMELMLLADTVDAAEALRLGMVHRVVPAFTLADQTAQLVWRLARGPTLAYGATKRLLRASCGRDLRTQMDAERDALCACAASADFAAGVEAFLGRRAAAFTAG